MNVKATGEGTNWWAQSVKKCVYSDYVHTDRLGSVVNLTDQYGRVPAQVDYDDWGKVTAYQSLNISGGYRTVLPEITYAGHQYDDVLGMYYAKARMYDAENRRFAATDPVKGRITEPMTLVQYLYVVDNPLRWVDLLGLRATMQGGDLVGGTVTQKDVEQAATDFAPYSYNVSSLSSIATRELDMERGIVAALLINAGESAGKLLQLLKDLGTLTHILPSDNDFNFYTQTSQNLRDIETYLYLPQVTFKDSYYAGKMLGDLISAAVGVGVTLKGLAKMVTGAGGITAGVLESSSGAGVAAGIPTIAAGVATAVEGVAASAAGLDISARALGSFGDDLGKFDYYKKLLCESKRKFKSPEKLLDHYNDHGKQIAKAKGVTNYSVEEYLSDANYIIENGTYTDELKGYVRFISRDNYGFVGLDRTTGEITTFHIKKVSELSKKAPSLGIRP